VAELLLGGTVAEVLQDEGGGEAAGGAASLSEVQAPPGEGVPGVV